MAVSRTVLVTGVAGHLGGQVAARLLTLPGVNVIGLDMRPPTQSIQGLDFIRADLRNTLLPDLFDSEGIDTVVHMAFQETDRPSEAGFDANVQGTIKLMHACQKAGVRRAVIPSSTTVYGARPENSSFLSEEHPLHGSRRWGSARDMVEIESFCTEFCRQNPRPKLTILRFASIVGLQADSAMTRFLREPWTPVLLGFDPMMQVIHEEDVLGALLHATVNEVSGIYNVAAEGPLPLSQLLAVAGKVPLPVLHLGVYWALDLARAAGFDVGRHVPLDPDYLRYTWVADLERMRLQLGFSPQYTALETLREFATHQRLARFLPEEAARVQEEKRLRDTIERRRRIRTRAAGGPVTLAGGAPEDGHHPLVSGEGDGDD